jgi:hypothetical protein
MVLRKLASSCRRLKLGPYLSPCTQINSKWIKEVNISSETLKLLWENSGRHRSR